MPDSGPFNSSPFTSEPFESSFSKPYVPFKNSYSNEKIMKPQHTRATTIDAEYMKKKLQASKKSIKEVEVPYVDIQRSALTRNSQSNLILSKTNNLSSNSLKANQSSLLKLKKSLNEGMKTAKKKKVKQSVERLSRDESAFIETPKEAHKKWR